MALLPRQWRICSRAKACSATAAQLKLRELLDISRSFVGSEDWAPSKHRGEAFGPETNKCNLFVSDMLEWRLMMSVDGYSGGRLFSATFGWLGSPPGIASARDLKSTPIAGFEIVQGDPIPGDILSSGTHVAIVNGGGTSISAATYGFVVNRGWGCRNSHTGNPRFAVQRLLD